MMTLSRTRKLAVASILCALAAAPAAAAHQTPQHAKHVVHNALTSGAWTPMIDESRIVPPFNRLADDADALARFLNRP